MRNLLYMTTVFAAAAFTLAGCRTEYTTYDGPSAIAFADTASRCPVMQDGTSYGICIAATRPADHDRTFAVETVPSKSTAVYGRHFTIDDQTVTIKAGETAAEVYVKGIYDNVDSSDDTYVTLRLVGEGNPEALPPIAIDEPTMSMLFTINNSPFFGKDGKFVTSRHIKERLDKELEKNLALRVKPGLNADSFVVFGRGVLHLSVLIEEMRREGFELQVGQPKVLDKTINGQRCEPIEELSIEVPEQFVGAAIEISTRRKGALIHMEPRGDRTLLEFEIPTRGLMGLRSNLLTASQGEAVVAHRFKDYQPYKGEIEHRTNGSLVSLETGEAIAYSMNKLLDRGKFFVEPGEEIYMGEVVGEHTRDRDLNVNICKTKKLTNVRAAGSDEKIVLPPAIKMSLEEMLEYINEDELVEVTPHHLRIRKTLLDPTERKRKSGEDD